MAVLVFYDNKITLSYDTSLFCNTFVCIYCIVCTTVTLILRQICGIVFATITSINDFMDINYNEIACKTLF